MSTNEDLLRELEKVQKTLDDGFARIDLRIDHVVGKHDFCRVTGCPSCEVK